MKLAELLIKRKSAKSKLAYLTERLNRNAKVQEGDDPQENPEDLLKEISVVLVDVQRLTEQINRTNANTPFPNPHESLKGPYISLADALVYRERLVRAKNIYSGLLDALTIKEPRFGRLEIKYKAVIASSGVKAELDRLTETYQALDATIQRINWETDAL